eukprot:ANDGO_06135.mRNA.1 Uncharacterized protein C18B11.02c
MDACVVAAKEQDRCHLEPRTMEMEPQQVPAASAATSMLLQPLPSAPLEIHRRDSDYAYLCGLRHVFPYVDVRKAWVKRRWVGRSLINVLETEFCEDDGYFPNAIENGFITVNGSRPDPQLVLMDKHHIEHKMHRHEKQVLDIPICKIGETVDYVVFNKPPSLPVHPCGRFFKNSLLYIAEHEFYPGKKLYSVNRLDRLTSGVVVFAKTSVVAEKINKKLRDRTMQKVYYARVHGEFNSQKMEPVRIEKRMVALNEKDGVHGCTDDPTLGVEACTEVRFVRYFEACDQSIVACKPYTGRTHQIRVHLQAIGHPIVNDPDYGMQQPSHYDRHSVAGDSAEAERPSKRMRNAAFDLAGISDECRAFLSPVFEGCSECRKRLLISDPASLFICLHAWKYEIEENIVYEAPPPKWVSDEDWGLWVRTSTISPFLHQLSSTPSKA